MYYSSLNIIATRGAYQLASDNVYLFFSDNYGKTWKNRVNWGTQYTSSPVYNRFVDFAYIFSDGTLIFACSNTMYRSTDQLATTPTAVTDIQNPDGSSFVFHTPSNATRPGNYFKMPIAGQTNHVNINGVEMLVWNNYCNQSYLNGAAPVTCWYTVNNGETIKAFYRFGQNTNFRDNGTQGGGTSGTLLGDAGNAIITHHGHGIHWQEGTNDFYFGTGDYDTRLSPYGNEIHVFRATYDTDLDEWTVTRIISNVLENNRFKLSGILSDGDNLYFGSDATATFAAVPTSEHGVFITNTSDILTSTSTRFAYPNSQNTQMHSIMFNNNKSKMLIVGDGATLDYQTGFYIKNMNTLDDEFVAVPLKTSGQFWVNPYCPDGRGYIKIGVGGFKFPFVRTVFIRP